MLVALHIQPQYARMERMSLSRAMRCAAYFDRIEMLKWVQIELPKQDPSWLWEPELMEMALLDEKGKEPPPSIELLESLYEHSPPVCLELDGDDSTIGKHVQRGNLDVLAFFLKRDRILNKR